MGEGTVVEREEPKKAKGDSKSGLEYYDDSKSGMPIEPAPTPTEPTSETINNNICYQGGRHLDEIAGFTTGDVGFFTDGEHYLLRNNNKFAVSYEGNHHTGGMEYFDLQRADNSRVGTPKDRQATTPDTGYLGARWDHYVNASDKFVIDGFTRIKSETDKKGGEFNGTEYKGDPDATIDQSVKLGYARNWLNSSDKGDTKYELEGGLRLSRVEQQDNKGKTTGHDYTIGVDVMGERRFVAKDGSAASKQHVAAFVDNAGNYDLRAGAARSAYVNGENKDILRGGVDARLIETSGKKGVNVDAGILYVPKQGNDKMRYLAHAFVGGVEVNAGEGMRDTLLGAEARAYKEGDLKPTKDGGTKRTDLYGRLTYFAEGDVYHDYDVSTKSGGQFIQNQIQAAIGFEHNKWDADGDKAYRFYGEAGLVYFPKTGGVEGLAKVGAEWYWGDPAPTQQRITYGRVDGAAAQIHALATDHNANHRMEDGASGVPDAGKDPRAFAQYAAQFYPSGLYRLNTLVQTGQTETSQHTKIDTGAGLFGQHKDRQKFYSYLASDEGQKLVASCKKDYEADMKKEFAPQPKQNAVPTVTKSASDRADFIRRQVSATSANDGAMTFGSDLDRSKLKDGNGNTFNVTPKELVGFWAKSDPKGLKALHNNGTAVGNNAYQQEFYSTLRSVPVEKVASLAKYAPAAVGGSSSTGLAEVKPTSAQEAVFFQAALTDRGYSVGKTGDFADGVDGKWGKSSATALRTDLAKLESEYRAQNGETFKNNREQYNADFAAHAKATYEQNANSYIAKIDATALQSKEEIVAAVNKDGKAVEFKSSLDWTNAQAVADRVNGNPDQVFAVQTFVSKEGKIGGLNYNADEIDQAAYAKFAEGKTSEEIQKGFTKHISSINLEATRLAEFSKGGGLTVAGGGVNYAIPKVASQSLASDEAGYTAYRVQLAINAKVDGKWGKGSEKSYESYVESKKAAGVDVTSSELVAQEIEKDYHAAIAIPTNKSINEFTKADWQKVQYTLEDSGHKLYDKTVTDLTGAINGGKTQTALLQAAVASGAINEAKLTELGYDLNKPVSNKAVFDKAVANGDLDTNKLFVSLNENSNKNSYFFEAKTYDLTTVESYEKLTPKSKETIEAFLNAKNYKSYDEFLTKVKSNGEPLTNESIAKQIIAESEPLRTGTVKGLDLVIDGTDFTKLSPAQVATMSNGQKAALVDVLQTQTAVPVEAPQDLTISNPTAISKAYNSYVEAGVKNGTFTNNPQEIADHLNSEVRAIETETGSQYKEFNGVVLGPQNVDKSTVGVLRTIDSVGSKIEDPKNPTKEEIASLTKDERSAIILAGNQSKIESSEVLVNKGTLKTTDDAAITTALQDYANKKDITDSESLTTNLRSDIATVVKGNEVIKAQTTPTINPNAVDESQIGVVTTTTKGTDLVSLVGGISTTTNKVAPYTGPKLDSLIGTGVTAVVNVVNDGPNDNTYIQFSPNTPEVFKNEFINNYTTQHNVDPNKVVTSELTPETTDKFIKEGIKISPEDHSVPQVVIRETGVTNLTPTNTVDTANPSRNPIPVISVINFPPTTKTPTTDIPTVDITKPVITTTVVNPNLPPITDVPITFTPIKGVKTPPPVTPPPVTPPPVTPPPVTPPPVTPPPVTPPPVTPPPVTPPPVTPPPVTPPPVTPPPVTPPPVTPPPVTPPPVTPPGPGDDGGGSDTSKVNPEQLKPASGQPLDVFNQEKLMALLEQNGIKVNTPTLDDKSEAKTIDNAVLTAYLGMQDVKDVNSNPNEIRNADPNAKGDPTRSV